MNWKCDIVKKFPISKFTYRFNTILIKISLEIDKLTSHRNWQVGSKTYGSIKKLE